MGYFIFSGTSGLVAHAGRHKVGQCEGSWLVGGTRLVVLPCVFRPYRPTNTTSRDPLPIFEPGSPAPFRAGNSPPAGTAPPHQKLKHNVFFWHGPFPLASFAQKSREGGRSQGRRCANLSQIAHQICAQDCRHSVSCIKEEGCAKLT